MVEIRRVEAAEGDEMWSFVGNTTPQRWLWHAIDQLTGVVLAYVLGTRADTVFTQLHTMRQPFGLVHGLAAIHHLFPLTIGTHHQLMHHRCLLE